MEHPLSRSTASYLRCVRSLFTSDIISVLRLKLPANPFVGVKLKGPGPQRYHSEINPEWLLACAERELRTKEPQQYLALFLCLWAGLRRREADLLMWKQIDFNQGCIHIRRTAHFEPKTEESQRMIDLAPEAVDVLRSFKRGSTRVCIKGSTTKFGCNLRLLSLRLKLPRSQCLAPRQRRASAEGDSLAAQRKRLSHCIIARH